MTDLVTPRISPLEPPYAPEVAAQLESMMPPGVPPIRLFTTFAKHLPMAKGLSDWGRYYLSDELSLTMRHREIVIDRVTARCGCEYEWGVHVAFFADRVEFSEDQVRSLTRGDGSDLCWTAESDRVLIEVVDSLHDTAALADDLWARFSATFDEAQCLDVFLLSGWYHAISYAANGARVALEDGAPRFSDV